MRQLDMGFEDPREQPLRIIDMAANTPENKIKRKITNMLEGYRPYVWFFMPGAGIYQRATVDYVGCVDGYFFAVEAKAPGGKATLRQMRTMHHQRAAGGRTFVVSNEDELETLRQFIEETIVDAPEANFDE